jgi:DNA replication licensing factor MCM5
MAGWDIGRVAASELHLQQPRAGEDAGGAQASEAEREAERHSAVQSKFRQFLRGFEEEGQFIYRDQLDANYGQRAFFLDVDARHVQQFDNDLLERLIAQPASTLPVFELAAKDMIALSVAPRPELSDIPHIQVRLRNFERFTSIRALDARHVSRLVCVRGIVVSAGKVRIKATTLSIMCRNCKAVRHVSVNPGFGGARIPRLCDTPNPDAASGANNKCPLDPYIILPDSTKYIDQQRLKLQENPEEVPTGEMPRHVSVSLDGYLAGQTKPGTRVNIVGIYSIIETRGQREDKKAQAVALRYPYLRAVGVQASAANGDIMAGRFRPEDEDALRALAAMPGLYDKIARSIAPAIYGSEDIKKAIACMLFCGSRKVLRDNMRLRGDINVLLLGDPSTAKSQFLKFAVQVAPIGVYTSGKGSSAAGLTASVIRDPSTGEFQLEGGALVLADGGLVCIDEFDKMRAQDRVAIHEAMEQQTISIAKAGITTILNSRASVLAAANPVFGRYDDMKSPTENIDFQSTILSRFDLIFIVRDVRNEERDRAMARYVVGVHRQDPASRSAAEVQGEIEIDLLKKYIAFARSRCQPRLSEEAGEKLVSHYVSVRAQVHQREVETGGSAIPITVRQLEAIVRISESLARMELSDVAGPQHVDEAIRLFTVSTFSAATSNFGPEGLGPEFMERVKRAEQLVRRRLPIGAKIATRQLTAELVQASFPEAVASKTIDVMAQRGELEARNQGKLLYRAR